MKKYIVLLFIFLLGQSIYAQEFDKKIIEQTVLKECGDKSVPGVSIAIIKEDKLIYSNAFGYANTTTKIKTNPDMIFRLGSTTKMFVAAAVLILESQGKLDLDAPIEKYAPGLSPKIGLLTMHQLLTHTSGLFDDAPMSGPADDKALEREVRSWTGNKVFLQPGRFMSYSNPGYWLAGYVIESIMKIPFADAMKEILFKPLAMTHTLFRLKNTHGMPLAVGHDKDEDVIDPPANHAGTYPSGSMFSNIDDISHFVIALMNYGMYNDMQVLPVSVVEKLMHSYVDIPDKKGVSYGYGLAFENRRGADFIFHNGARIGYGSMIRMIPREEFAVIILTNRTGALLSKTADAITEQFVPLNETISVEQHESFIMEGNDFEGDFICPEIAEMEFFKRGILHLKRGWHRVPVKKIGRDLYSDYIYPFTVTRGPDGKVEFIHIEYHTLKRKE